MLQPSALTTPRPDVGRALATLAKRCARALGSDRWPRRHVSTNTTPRFCVHHGPRRQAGRACLCKGEEGSRTWGKCRANTRSWRAQRFSHATLGRGCGVRVLRPVQLLLPPGRAVQTDHPVCTPCARHQQSCSTGKQSHGGRRSATWCLGSHSAEATYQSRAPGRIVWRASATRRPAPASTLSG